MSWKDLNKSSYTTLVNKFQEWVPARPFSIILDANKIRYSEGDEITSADNPVFNVDFTSQPLGNLHAPCGYWHKGYVPYSLTYYTSKPYPIDVVEELQILSSTTISARLLSPQYDYGYIQIGSNSLVSGAFYVDFILVILNPTIESFTIVSNTLVSGTFYLDSIIVTIDNGYDGVQLSTNTLVSGTFDDVVISYEYWPAEGIQINSNTLESGAHGV